MTNEDRAYEIIEKTLPIAPEFGAYADLLKAIIAALDEAEKRGEDDECDDDTADDFEAFAKLSRERTARLVRGLGKDTKA